MDARAWPPILVLVCGCKADQPGTVVDAAADTAPSTTNGPLTLEPRDHGVGFAELPKAELRFDLTEQTYAVRFNGFPPGTGATVGGRALLMSPDIETFEVGDLIADLPPLKALSDGTKVDPKIAIEVRVPGHAPTRLDAPPLAAYWQVRELLGKAADHPVLFSGETSTDTPREPHSTLLLDRPELFGPAQKLREVDRVVVVRNLAARRDRLCGVETDFIDEEASLVERKTTRVVQRKRFAARTDFCPPDAGRAVSYPDSGAVARWVRDLVSAR